MKLISRIWRSLCLRPSTDPEEPGDSIPEAEPNATSKNLSVGEPSRVREDSELLEPSLPESSMQTTSEETPNVIIFMPPPPVIHWPSHRSLKGARIPPETSSPLPQRDVTESASSPPVSAEPAPSVAPPQTKEEYAAYTEEFVAENIENFANVTEESVKTIAERAAAQADIITKELGLRPETTPGLVKLAFYDFVILCDDSYSMTSDPQLIPSLNDTLRRVAHFATILQPKGISIRFLNHDEGNGREYDDLVDKHDISMKVESVNYDGNTRLGQVLDEKIVQPKIINKIISGKLDRPVFVVIITDGLPTEPPESLRNTIRNCKNFLSRQSYSDAAAVFLISQIGSDPSATIFLRSLETDPQISNMVFCSTENLAAKLAQFQSSLQDKQYTAWLIELFLAALDKQTKHS